jgi:hypothetical protein
MAVLKPFRDVYGPDAYYLWKYVPSIAASVIFIILFLAMAGLHAWRQFKTKQKFCWPFTIGVFCESSCFNDMFSYLSHRKAKS